MPGGSLTLTAEEAERLQMVLEQRSHQIAAQQNIIIDLRRQLAAEKSKTCI